MNSDKIKVGLIYGSTREGRFCETVANWAAGEIEKRGFLLDAIDPKLLDLPAWHGHPDKSAVNALKKRLGAADAFVVVTPEYNHGYPAALKAVIDSANAEWNAKPVGFVSYGGISGGLRAVEQLRLVFAEVHATTTRDAVSFAHVWSKFDSAGNLIDPKEPTAAMAIMLARLNWWATILRDARRDTPYQDIAA